MGMEDQGNVGANSPQTQIGSDGIQQIVTQGITPTNPTVNNSVMEGALLTQLINMTDPDSLGPSSENDNNTGGPESTPQTEGGEFSAIESTGKGGKGEGGAGGDAGGGRNGGSDSNNTGYDSSTLHESVGGDIAKLQASDLQVSFEQADYSKMVAVDSISDAQTASSGALSEAALAASQTQQSSIDQADAQITQAAGQLASGLASAGLAGAALYSTDNTTASENANQYDQTNKSLKNLNSTPPAPPRTTPPTTVYARQDGVIQNGNGKYDPSSSDIKLNTNAEYSQDQLGQVSISSDPATPTMFGRSGPIYTAKEAENPSAIPAGKDVNGFTKEQKLAAIAKDNGNVASGRPKQYEFPSGTYSTAQRQSVLSGKPITRESNDPTTNSILVDAKSGDHNLQAIANKMKPSPGSPEQSLQGQLQTVHSTATPRTEPAPPAGTIKGSKEYAKISTTTGSIDRDTSGIAKPDLAADMSYDPATSPEPLSSREINLAKGQPTTYSAEDRQNYIKWKGSWTTSKTPPIKDDPEVASGKGFTAGQKQTAIEADLKMGDKCVTNQRPEGSYTTEERQQVASGKALENDPDGSKTRSILQDMKLGRHPAPTPSGATPLKNTSYPDPTHNTPDVAEYNENGVATGKVEGDTKLNRYHEYSQDEIGVDTKTGTLKPGGGPVYTEKDLTDYNRWKNSTVKGSSPKLQDDDINGISGHQKMQAIEADQANGTNMYMFPKGSYTTADREEFISSGKLSNDADGTKRTAMLQDMRDSGDTGSISNIRQTSQKGLKDSLEMKMQVASKYNIYSSMIQGVLGGVTGIGAAQLTIEAAQQKMNSELSSATAQQLYSSQQLDAGQGLSVSQAAMSAATGTIQAAMNLISSAMIKNQ
jgi:hypothetical protein